MLQPHPPPSHPRFGQIAPLPPRWFHPKRPFQSKFAAVAEPQDREHTETAHRILFYAQYTTPRAYNYRTVSILCGGIWKKLALRLDRRIFFHYNSLAIEVWRSLVSRLVRVQETSGSNPDTSTKNPESVYAGSGFFIWMMAEFSLCPRPQRISANRKRDCHSQSLVRISVGFVFHQKFCNC